MSKIIVKNYSKLNDMDALYYVNSVMNMGRISGECYCFVTTYEMVRVFADRTKTGADVFRIEDVAK